MPQFDNMICFVFTQKKIKHTKSNVEVSLILVFTSIPFYQRTQAFPSINVHKHSKYDSEKCQEPAVLI